MAKERPKFLMEATIEELEVELKKRKEPKPPEMNIDSNLSVVEGMLKDYVNAKGVDYQAQDFAHDVLDALLEAYYGKNVWDWLNK